MGTSPQDQLSANLTAADQAGASVRIRLHWANNKPWSVHLHFPDNGNVTWTLLRSMLAEGFTRPVGEGDVRIRPHNADLLITLTPPSGALTLRVNADDLANFLRLSYETTSYHDEDAALTDYVDNEITKLLQQSPGAREI